MFSWRDNSKLLIQGAHTAPVFIDMLRLTYQRHAAYAVSHSFDYWHFIGNPCPERTVGAWDKIHYIKNALVAGYEYIVWLDCDTAIVGDTDMLEALTPEQHIGGCIHDANNIQPHINVGALYFRNTEQTRAFVDAWHDSYPGDERWHEQGSFNDLREQMPGIVSVINDRWNATINVNEAPDAVVVGYHGIWPHIKRLNIMRLLLKNDFLKYRV